MKKLYHVTSKENWERIKVRGLKPRIGVLAGPIAEMIWAPETHKAVFLFTKIGDEDFWYFVNNWLAYAHEGKENLVLLEVKLPKKFRKIDKRIERAFRNMKVRINSYTVKKYPIPKCFYNYEERGGNEFVCYKKIPAKYITCVPFPMERNTKADDPVFWNSLDDCQNLFEKPEETFEAQSSEAYRWVNDDGE